MLLTRFWKNRQGSIAPLFGLAIIPLIAGVGSAIDYTRASAARTAFQSSLDSAALMLAKTAALQTPAQIEAEATTYVNALFTANNAKNVTITAAYSTTAGSELVLTGTALVLRTGLEGSSQCAPWCPR